MTKISGDSDEYDFLTKAVEISKDVDGMCCEIGLRLGMGTKTIIDAVRQHCPDKLVVSVDPFGNIPYTGREPDGETHYDYTDDMRNECMANMWAYVRGNKVDYRFFNLSDYDYFAAFSKGVPYYDYNGSHLNSFYSMIHLDAQHTISDVSRQVKWFNKKMKSGSVIAIDDCSPDFLDIRPVNNLIFNLGWDLVKEGGKKNLYVKR